MSLHNLTSMGCNQDILARWTVDYKTDVVAGNMPNVLPNLLGYLFVNVIIYIKFKVIYNFF